MRQTLSSYGGDFQMFKYIQVSTGTDEEYVDHLCNRVEESLDKEAVRVVKAMPPWNPGRQGGKNVRVKYTLPIRFRIG